jgi:hypothetical protein
VPVWFDAVEAAGLPDRGSVPTGTYTSGSLWWDHEDLHRTVLLDYARLRALIEPQREQVQARIDNAAAAALAGTVEDRVECTRTAFAEAADAYAEWLRIVEAAAPSASGRSPYHRAWRGFDKSADRQRVTPAGAR